MATMHLEDLEGREGQRVQPRTATMRQVDPVDQVDQGLRLRTAMVHPVDLTGQVDLRQKQQEGMMLLVDPARKILMGMLDHRPPLDFTLHRRILAQFKPLAVIKVQVGLALTRSQASPDNQLKAMVHQEKVTMRQAWVAIMIQRDLGRLLVGWALVLKILTVTMTLRPTTGELCQ